MLFLLFLIVSNKCFLPFIVPIIGLILRIGACYKKLWIFLWTKCLNWRMHLNFSRLNFPPCCRLPVSRSIILYQFDSREEQLRGGGRRRWGRRKGLMLSNSCYNGKRNLLYFMLLYLEHLNSKHFRKCLKWTNQITDYSNFWINIPSRFMSLWVKWIYGLISARSMSPSYQETRLDTRQDSLERLSRGRNAKIAQNSKIFVTDLPTNRHGKV